MKSTSFVKTTVVSAFALMIAVGSAQAEISNGSLNKNHPGVETGTTPSDSPETRNVKESLIKADSAMREGADEIRAFFAGDAADAKFEPVVFRRDITAEAMLDTDVVDAQGKKIAKVDDILLDSKGRPTKVIVSEGGVMGVGDKKAAFDYGAVKTTTNKDGERVVTGLSEQSIKQEPKAPATTAEGASVNAVLDGSILDNQGEAVADIENLAFNGGDSQLIVKFNDTFGMGGDLAAIRLNSLERVDTDGKVNYRLSAAQTTKFKSYKAAVE